MFARLNHSERVLLMLAEEDGASAEMFEGLEEGSRRALSEAPCQEVGPLERLASEPPADFAAFADSVGMCAVARLVVERTGGATERVGRVLPPHARDGFDRWLRYWSEVTERDSDETSDIDPQTRRRIVESFAGFQKQTSELMEAVRELGFLVVASAAGYRCRARLERLITQLPEETGSRLNSYYRVAYLSSRRNTGAGFRRLLEVACDGEDDEQTKGEA